MARTRVWLSNPVHPIKSHCADIFKIQSRAQIQATNPELDFSLCILATVFNNFFFLYSSQGSWNARERRTGRHPHYISGNKAHKRGKGGTSEKRWRVPDSNPDGQLNREPFLSSITIDVKRFHFQSPKQPPNCRWVIKGMWSVRVNESLDFNFFTISFAFVPSLKTLFHGSATYWTEF